MTDRYLFAYFTSGSERHGESVHFARSRGDSLLDWETLGGGSPILTSTVGTTGVRDPFLIRAAGLDGERAQFYMVATDLRTYGKPTDTAWTDALARGSRNLVVWESSNLVQWSQPSLAEVAPPDAGNAWAPEVVFDPVTASYLVFWASALHMDSAGEPTDDRSGTPSHSRMLISSTRDFQTFTPASVWVDPGWSVIDATVVWHEGWFWRFSKDERSPESTLPASKFILLERSRDIRSTTWEYVREGIGAGPSGLTHGEGPIAAYSSKHDRWFLFIDEFGLRRYIAFSTDNLETGVWRQERSDGLPGGASHGSILKITEAEWSALSSCLDPSPPIVH